MAIQSNGQIKLEKRIISVTSRGWILVKLIQMRSRKTLYKEHQQRPQSLAQRK